LPAWKDTQRQTKNERENNDQGTWNTYHFDGSHVRIGRVPSCQITDYEHPLERRVEGEYGRRLRRCDSSGVDVLRCVRSFHYHYSSNNMGGK
jgi:hypothetical protein